MTKRNDGALGLVAIACGSVLFGTLGVATKGILTTSDANAISIALWRVLIAVPILLVLGLVTLRGQLFAIARRDLRLMIGAGVLMAFYQIAFVTAVQMANVTIAALVTVCTAPLFVAILASVFLKEQIHRNVLVAMACAVVGVALLVGFQPTGNIGTNLLLGIGLALLTAITNAFFQITSRALAPRYAPIQPLLVYFVVSGLLFLPFALLTTFVTNFSPVGWALIFHLGVSISIAAYFLYLFGLRTTPATTATVIGFIEPLTAAILAFFIFNEQLSSTGLLGAVLLVGAMVLVWRTTVKQAIPVTEL